MNYVEENRDALEFSPLLLKFGEVLEKFSKNPDDLSGEFLPAEFRDWPLRKDLDPYLVFFKRRGKQYWTLNYRTPRVAIYRIVTKKVTDPDTGSPLRDEDGNLIYEDVPVHEQTIFNFVPVRIREFHDFTLELAAKEANMNAPLLYQWIIAENSLNGLYIRELEPALHVEILDKLKEIGGLYTNESLAKEAIDSILVLAKYLGAIEHVHKPMVPGIYWNPNTNQLEAYGFDTSMPSRVAVRDALELLNRIVRANPDPRWYSSWPVKFGKIFKWSLVAGLGYAYKVYNEKRRWLPYLLFVGESLTGKTQIISKVITYIWKPLGKATPIGASWSVYNFSELISSVASVVVVNESAPLFKSVNSGDESDNFFNLIKSAPEQYLFRTKSYKGVRKVYPSLAILAFNANMPGIRDEAIRRRFFTVEFTKVDKLPLDASKYFEKNIVPYLDVLSAIGRFVFNVIRENPILLGLSWEELSEELVRRLYEYALLDLPEWLSKASLADNYREELEEDKRDIIVTWLRKHFDDIYAKYARYAEGSTIRDRVFYVLDHDLSPYFIRKGKKIIIRKSLLDALKSDTKIDLYSFKALCELLGWEYTVKWIQGSSSRVAITSLDDFCELIGAVTEAVNLKLMQRVIDILGMGGFTFDELLHILQVREEELREIIEELEAKMVILVRDGRYILNRSRAKELGFEIV